MVSIEQIQTDSLQFNVAGLLSGPKGGARHYKLRIPVSEMDQLDEAFDVIAPLIGTAKFLWSNERIVVIIQGETAVTTQCSRCLEPIEQVVNVSIEEAFTPAVDLTTGKILASDETDPALRIDVHHILDLSEILRQSILLTLPLTPLCKIDCAGLCPSCGANLNETSCTCQTETSDPRWAALSEFFNT